MENLDKQIELLNKVKSEVEQCQEITEVEVLQKKITKDLEQIKNLRGVLKTSEIELSEKLDKVKSELSTEVYNYLYPEVKKVTSKKDSNPNGESLYCKVLKEIFVNGKNLRMAIKEIYGDDSIKTLEKAVKNVIWSGQKNGLIEVLKPASFKDGLFVEGEIVLTEAGKALVK